MRGFQFGRRQDSFRTTFAEFSKSLTLIADPEQLRDNVIARIREIVPAELFYFFFYVPEHNQFELIESRGSSAPHPGQIAFKPENPLVRWFTVNETHVQFSHETEVTAYLSPEERRLLENLSIDLMLPLIVLNRVSGLVGIGPRHDNGVYTDEEVEILTTLLGHAAFAFENAYLYQQQKNRLKRMYRADRLATLGQLAAGAAHEIRNPLTSIRSTIQYLQKGLNSPDQQTLAGELLGEVDRINDIIEGLLSFSRPSTPQMEDVDLRALLDQTVSLVATTAQKQKVSLTCSYETGMRSIHADPAQLKQVFLNILMNGLQAMESVGELRVSVRTRSGDSFPESAIPAVLVTFQDTGAGIPADHLEHLFDPFFTTKKDGTGLGLSISYGIIQQHGGDIDITSMSTDDNPEEHGTTVTVTLPITRNADRLHHP